MPLDEGCNSCTAWRARAAERILQRANARAHRGLADPQARGGPVESAVGSHGQERLELIDFHEFPFLPTRARSGAGGTKRITGGRISTFRAFTGRAKSTESPDNINLSS